MLQPYSIARKTIKWYKKLTMHLLHAALLNSYILREKCGGRGSFLTFQYDIAAAFLSGREETADTADKNKNLRCLSEQHLFP